ncbi:response regulator transcription factor [Variovorax paradoxus]|nr:response regulator [Variovorax paradoxus]MBT2304185.1 response regulator transcription factor [Variovorax paradoxus]
MSNPIPIPIVFVVDDDESVRRSLRLLIESAGWRAETFGSAREFLSRPQAFTAPSCLVLDVVLPDLNGCEVQSQIADRAELPVIFISGYSDVPTTVRAMKGGAVEFFTKPFAGDVVLGAIRNALNRSGEALADVEEMQALRDRHSLLSPREREIMALVVSGRLNKQMGVELGISEITVKAHRGQVMRKMKADSLCGLVRMAFRLCVGPDGENGKRTTATTPAGFRSIGPAHATAPWESARGTGDGRAGKTRPVRPRGIARDLRTADQPA